MSTSPHPLFSFSNLTKTFGTVVANREVSFSVSEGTIHGIVGENGAGKSTIMKILYGMFEPDSGSISLRGNPTRIRTPQDAIALGIGMVHQHFMLVPTLSVWENIILGAEPTPWLLNKPLILKELEFLKMEFGFQVDLETKIEALPVGHQQQVELLKLLYRRANILILDEPTAVLTPQEVDSLFQKLKTLKKANKTIIVITHKLKEILSFTDTVTIMRQGRALETLPTKELTEETLAEKIIGRKRIPLDFITPSAVKEPILKVASLSLQGPNGPRLHQVSFEVNRGEIVGIAGIEGNGQHELIECLSGIQKDYSGAVIFKNTNTKEISPYALKQRGFSLIPPDRHREAVVLPFSISENIILGHHRELEIRSGPFISQNKVNRLTLKAIHGFDVRPDDPNITLSSLSGGNQQKLVVARESGRSPQFLLAANPTRGIDIGAIDFIHQHFLGLKAKGAGILLLSSELEEILKLSDRILVLFQGKIVAQLFKQDATEKELGLRMTGGTAP